MKRASWSILLVWAFLVGCRDQQDVSIGNGFLLHASGTTLELHPAKISLYLKVNGRAILVWPSLNSSCGGPIPIRKGLLFTARNQFDEDAIFAADDRGTVAEITSFVQPGMSSKSELRQIKEIGDKIQVDLWDGAGQSVSILLTKEELMKIAEQRISNGKKARWGKVDFYQ